ncbi:uncharacterized protein ACA1_195220 [Acanthamoeba castellanii str. Neff]|uniref:Chalcone isomerase domain-containing protein n=1 Tax=Acanthamoeba castellanii (strain ATCC 30010 / Neff) TaxID=1257118 RepID=L8H5I9_ACACF|nr:uncharacterized protein ACA1_195220 [Acanthamoeba castellanii str. Neff]ELR20440.1 hypothetical protein ACA1_195220 [Acanthamoeba castellanii str. Neff]
MLEQPTAATRTYALPVLQRSPVVRSTTSWGWGLASGVALAALASSCRSADESPLSPLATVLAATAAAGDVPADSVKEERSGFLFPKTLRLDDSTEGQVLAVGIRTMYVFFTTYAIALYADPKDVRSALSSFKEHSAEDLKKNQAVYDALRDGPFTKTIRLIPTGDTSGSHLRNGLVSAVAARMQDNKEEALKEFGNFFPAQLKKGMLIDFTWKKGGSLSVSVDGKEVGVVDSPALSRAFFEVYLGEKSKTPDVREKWAVALTEWLR